MPFVLSADRGALPRGNLVHLNYVPFEMNPGKKPSC